MSSPTFTVRWAKDDEGPEIQALLESDGWNPLKELDWSKCGASWMVVEREGLLIGAVQVCMGIPVARIEMMTWDPFLSHQERAIAVRDLIGHALLAAKRFGASAASFLLGDERPGFQEIIERRGGVRVSQGAIYMKRI